MKDGTGRDNYADAPLCPECGETPHTRTCKRGEIANYRPPKSWREITARRNISAPLDFEFSGGRRRENKEKLR